MSPRFRAELRIWGIAAAVTVLAVALRWSVDPWVGSLRPLAALYGAVGIAAILGGYRAGLLAAVGGYLAARYLFIEPRGTLAVNTPDLAVNTIAFALNSGVIIVIGHALRVARQRAGALQRASQEAHARLECEMAERSRAEGALQDIHERNATILRSISDAFLVLDRDWRYVLLNAQAERYFGRPREEMLGRSLWEVFPQLVGTVFEREYRRAMDEDIPVQFETQSPVTGRWVEVHAYPSTDGLSVLFQDVTARREAQSGLEAKESQLRLIANAIPALISYIDRDCRYVWNNEAYATWFSRPGESVAGRHLREVLGDSAWQTIEPYVREALAGHAVQYTTEIRYQDGKRRWIDATYTPDRDEQGKVRGIVALVSDVTSRQEMEEKIHRSEERFRALIDNSWDGIVVVEGLGEIAYLSSSIQRILGYAPEELLGKHLFYLIHPDDRAEAEASLAQLLAEPGGSTSRQYRFRHRDGRWRRVEGVAVNLLHNPAVHGIVCNFRDVTEQVAAQEALLDSEQRFVRFMQNLPGLAWIKDADGRYVYANEAAFRAFGMPRSRVIGRTDDQLFPPATAAQFRQNDLQARASAGGIQTVETLEQPDGQLHYSIVSKFRIPGGEGEAGLVGGIAIDISELKRAEDALRDADRRKDEFLATLAHELRNPLAPIRNAVHLLRTDHAATREVQLARDIIDRQLSQMVRLVDDLLDVSRITRGKLQLRTARITLEEAVTSAVETSRPLIEQAGHELALSLPGEPLFLDADLTRLAQVFSNLLNNAAKYTDRGGKISLSAWREGSDVVVRVADTGIGIAPEQLPRIFEMFSQVTPAIDRTQGGLGIGLSLVRGLVEMHGGSIEARSAGVGRGSEFLVRLPLLIQTPAPQGDAPPGVAAPAAPGCRVLVVDDNQDAARSLAMMLGALGHTVETAFNGMDGLALAADFRPEVVLLDIGMPKLNGYEVAQRIRQEPWGRSLMLIAHTGWGQEEDKRQAREAGFDHHLTKPAKLEDLQRLIGAVTLESR